MVIEARLRRMRARRGFALLELIVVVAMSGILATIALPALKNWPRRAAEAVLKNNLRTIRDVIDQYHGDKGYYPPDLDELVGEGYLRSMPLDPMTKRTDSWVVLLENIDPDAPPAETEVNETGAPGVMDVRSGSDAVSLEGEPYSEW